MAKKTILTKILGILIKKKEKSDRNLNMYISICIYKIVKNYHHKEQTLLKY